MRSGIYQITNTVTGERYIGQTVRLSKRWTDHRRELSRGKHHSGKLQRSWNEHGADAFAFAPLVIADRQHLDLFEKRIVLSFRPELNMRVDHISGSPKGKKLKEETIAKLRGRKLSEEHRKNIGNARRGKKRPVEVAMKIADTLRRNREQRVLEGLPSRNVTRKRSDTIITPEIAARMRALYVPGRTRWDSSGVTIKEVGKMYGVSYLTAWKAIRGLI